VLVASCSIYSLVSVVWFVLELKGLSWVESGVKVDRRMLG
jgi:hypothetical protein